MKRITGKPTAILDALTSAHPELRRALDRISSEIAPAPRREIGEYQAAALYALVQEARPRTILEIGTARGYSAAVMAMASPDAQIVTLNPDQDEAALSRLNLHRLGLSERVQVVIARSTEYLPNVDTQFDLVFVDGDHKRVRDDLPYWDHVSTGGWMVFHDYSPVTSWRACPPVFVAVNEFGDMLGREPDWACIDDEQVGMAAYRRMDENPYRLLTPAPEGIIRRAAEYSVLPTRRLRHLWQIANTTDTTDAEGAVVCLGAGAGGAAAVLAAGMNRHVQHPVWLFDTFAGIPPPSVMDGDKAHDKYREKSGRWLVWDESMARQAVSDLAAADDLHVVAGLVQETLPEMRAQIGPIALLHLDMDWYDPTYAALDLLYAQMSPGGVVIADDYGHWIGAQKAVDQFRSERGVTARLRHTDYANVWWCVDE